MISANDEYFKFKRGACQQFRENYFFSEICAILPSKSQFGKKKETFRVYTREEVFPKPFFTAEAKVAA